MRHALRKLAAALFLFAAVVTAQDQWPVHDMGRPLPPVVTPGPAGPPVPAPSDAVVLFDGKGLGQWTDAKGQPAKWKVENGYMEVAPKSGDIRTVKGFGDCQLHVEWMAPSPAKGDGPGPRQQRRLPHGPLRGPGPRLL